MTAIAAFTDGQTIVLGGDSAGASRNELRLRADPKVFLRGSYAIGFTTSFRMGQILRWGVDLPEPPTGASAEELERFLVTELVETLRREFAAKGFAKRTRATIDGDPSATEEGQDRGGLFLLGVAGQIFEIRSDFQVARPLTSYTAIGNGAAVALGALHALERFPELTLRERVHRALEASEACCPGVRGPFHFVALTSAVFSTQR